jgi:hypothetical protein
MVHTTQGQVNNCLQTAIVSSTAQMFENIRNINSLTDIQLQQCCKAHCTQKLLIRNAVLRLRSERQTNNSSLRLSPAGHPSTGGCPSGSRRAGGRTIGRVDGVT